MLEKIKDMKKLIKILTILFISTISFVSCELLGDEEHCLNETVESRIWTPGTYPAIGNLTPSSPPYRSFGVIFCFSRVSHYSSFYKIDNACPYNAIVLDIKVKTKTGAFDNFETFKVSVSRINTTKGKKISNQIFLGLMNKKTDSEYFLQKVIELGGILDNGPAEFAVICGVTGYDNIFNPRFNDVLELENWTQQNVISVEYKANFIKWN